MKQHISCLDGIRGGLALWVFWGHLANAVRFQVPVVENLALAVDLFMLLSGFIMAWQWELSLQRPDPQGNSSKVAHFWLRRFFRISPLYYTLFFISIFVFPAWSEAKAHIRDTFHPLGMGVPSGVNLVSFGNIAAHLSYIYGLIPRLAANNALPDWSLSLEMQFYLAFPFLMLLCRPTRILLLSLTSVAICIGAQHLFSAQLGTGGSIAHFPQPSILPLKIHIFAAGMALGWLAANQTPGKSRIYFWIAFIIPLLIVPHPVAVAAVAISALILSPLRPVRAVAAFLGAPPFRLAGDLSYCVYLVHLIPSYFLLDYATHSPFFRGLPSGQRFGLAAIVLTPIIYALAYLAHRLVEKPGIDLGKRISGKALSTKESPRPARMAAA